ncbi:MAG: metallophosphoesterase family protein [Pirellulales bacterium]|nr:metallophosphoesterase family protein [Pirellulales bacterium]
MLFASCLIITQQQHTGAQQESHTHQAHTHHNSYAKHTHLHQAASDLPDRIVLTWSGDVARSVDVTWRTAKSTTFTVVEFTESASLVGDLRKGVDCRRIFGKVVLFDSNLGEYSIHSAQMKGLKPATKYTYRVGDGRDHWSEWFQFQTASDEPAPFSFIYFGDAQNEIRSWWSRVVREAYSQAPRAAFMLHAGDLVNRYNSDQEWGEWFGAGDWLNAMIPCVATPGNHEYEKITNKLTPHWRPQFSFPLNGPPGLEETVYWFDYQGVRFFSLNSNEKLEEQARWLENVLEEHPTKSWKIVTFHHPIYSATREKDNLEPRNTWKPTFDKLNIDLALQGHDHAYTRSGMGGAKNDPIGVNIQKGDTVYVVSVSGPKAYKLVETWQADRKASGIQLYQVIHIDGAKLRYEARMASGELYDAFTLEKGPDGRNQMTNQIPETDEIRE